MLRHRLSSPQYWRRSVQNTFASLQHVEVQKQCLLYNQPYEPPLRHNFNKQLVLVKSMATNNSLLNNDNIRICVIKAVDNQKVLEFLRIHYYLEEPLTVGSEPKEQDEEDEKFNMSNTEHGTCVMAVRSDPLDCNDHIVGALMAGPKGPGEAEHLFDEAAKLGPTKWGHTLQFLACVERDANVCARYQVEQVLHVHVIGVDNKVRGQNIGVRLVAKVLNLAKQLNYELVSVDCTSFYSARLFERMGFDCINTKYYNEYFDENKKQVFKPNPPHDCVKTFALKL